MLKMLRKPIVKKLAPIVLSLVIAGISAWQLMNYLETKRPMEEVLVAKRDIMPYTVITADDLDYISKPLGSRSEGAITRPQEAIGKMSLVPLFQGEEIFPQKLIDSSLALEEEDRAIAIPVDVIRSVGLSIKPGEKVDIYRVEETGDGAYFAELLADNAIVLDLLVNHKSYFSQNKTEEQEGQRTQKSEATPNAAIVKVKNSEVTVIMTTIESKGFVYVVKRK